MRTSFFKHLCNKPRPRIGMERPAPFLWRTFKRRRKTLMLPMRLESGYIGYLPIPWPTHFTYHHYLDVIGLFPLFYTCKFYFYLIFLWPACASKYKCTSSFYPTKAKTFEQTTTSWNWVISVTLLDFTPKSCSVMVVLDPKDCAARILPTYLSRTGIEVTSGQMLHFL